MMSSGSTRSSWALVSSQPNPVAPLLPNHRDDEKNDACEPWAANTTGRTPSSTTLSSFSPTVAYSEPSCWAYAYVVGPSSSAASTASVANTSWTISQSPSWTSFHWL